MKTFYRIYNTIIFIFLYAPIAVLIAYSFNESKNRGVFTGFTFDWYTRLFSTPEITDALGVTVSLALISSLACSRNASTLSYQDTDKEGAALRAASYMARERGPIVMR